MVNQWEMRRVLTEKISTLDTQYNKVLVENRVLEEKVKQKRVSLSNFEKLQNETIIELTRQNEKMKNDLEKLDKLQKDYNDIDNSYKKKWNNRR
jgi:nitrate reductase alpha subunit